MENRKLTAVEWLFGWMQHNQYFIGNDLIKAKQQAIELEKEQSIDFITWVRENEYVFSKQYNGWYQDIYDIIVVNAIDYLTNEQLYNLWKQRK